MSFTQKALDDIEVIERSTREARFIIFGMKESFPENKALKYLYENLLNVEMTATAFSKKHFGDDKEIRLRPERETKE